MLHVSNLPETVDLPAVEDVFKRHGTVAKSKRMQGNKMALIEMATVSEAVNALVMLHNTDLAGRQIRVSFSKSRLDR